MLDLDGEHGMNWMREKMESGQDLPETFSVRTGGGLHCYFAWPGGAEIKTSAGTIASGVDVRGQGGYVIAAGSIHPNGPVYESVDNSAPVADAPPWLLALVKTERKRAQVQDAPAWERIPEGQRNSKLASIGGGLRRKGAELPGIEEHLLDANARRCQPPLDDAEVRKIAASVSRYPVGGDDPLQCAWKAACATGEPKSCAGFLKLARTLQAARGDTVIILPLKRIAALFGVTFPAVQQWRKRAVKEGYLEPVGHYIPHRRAGEYRFHEKQDYNHASITSGLVIADGQKPIVKAGDPPIVKVGRPDRAHEPVSIVCMDKAVEFPFGYNAPRGLRR